MQYGDVWPEEMAIGGGRADVAPGHIEPSGRCQREVPSSYLPYFCVQQVDEVPPGSKMSRHDYANLENIQVIRNEESTNLIFAFSHVGYPVGKFAMSNEINAKNVNASIVYINCHYNSWYQAGINGNSDTIDKTASLLSEIMHNLTPSRVLTVGMSMGGYAALLFGCLLKVDCILAVTPELILGEELSRSLSLNNLQYYDPAYFSLHDILQDSKCNINLLFGCYDLNDLSLLWPSATFLERANPNLQMTFCDDGHKLALSLDIRNLCRNCLAIDVLQPEQIRKSIVKRTSHTSQEINSYALAQRFRRSRKFGAAIDVIDSITSIASEPWSSYFIADLYSDQGEVHKAFEFVLKAIDIDPKSCFLNQNAGLLAQRLGDYHVAYQMFTNALSERPYDKALQQLQARAEAAILSA